MSEASTVEELIDTLIELRDKGKGGYEVTCNSEYDILGKPDQVEVDDDRQVVDLGGWC